MLIHWIPSNWFCNRHMFPAKIVVFCPRVQLLLPPVGVFIKNSHTSCVDPPITFFNTIKPRTIRLYISRAFISDTANSANFWVYFLFSRFGLPSLRSKVGCTGLRTIPFYRWWIMCRYIFIGVTRWSIGPMFSPFSCQINIHKCFAPSNIYYLLCFFN